MNRFYGLEDINRRANRLYFDGMQKLMEQEEDTEIWDCLYQEEHELESLEQTHPNLCFLVKTSVGMLTEEVQDELTPEDCVRFRCHCLHSFLEVLGAIAENSRRGKQFKEARLA